MTQVLPSNVTDLFASEMIAPEFLLLLADRDGSVLTHPAMMHATGPMGSNVVWVRHIGLGGYDTLSSTTPGSDIATTAMSDNKTAVTVATRGKRYEMDDLAQFLVGGLLNPVAFAQDAVIAIAQTVISLAANVTDGFSATAGSSGVNATWANVLAAKATLGVAKANGEMLGLLHPVQWGDLELDAMSLGIGPAVANPGIVNTGLGAYKGRQFGIDFYVSSAVPTANGGADRAGGIWTRGGLCWADVEVEQALAADADKRISLGRGAVEFVRQGLRLASSVVVSHTAGVALGIDDAGVSLITDA